MTHARRAAAMFAAGVLLASTAALTAQPGAQLLRYRFHRGETLRYRVEMDVRARGAGQPAGGSAPGMRRTGTNELTVTKVNADGSALVTASQSSSLSGAARPGGARTVFTYTVTPLGQMRGIRGRTAAAPQVMGVVMNPDALSLMQAQLPQGAVRPGGTWSSTSPSPFKGGKPITIRARLLDVAAARGSATGPAVAHIRQSFVIPIDMTLDAAGQAMHVKGKVPISGTTGFNVAAGRIESSTSAGAGTLQFTSVGGSRDAAPMTLGFTFTMKMELMR